MALLTKHLAKLVIINLEINWLQHVDLEPGESVSAEDSALLKEARDEMLEQARANYVYMERAAKR